MTEIYLIRHAQAEGNQYRMMQGHWDGDITILGEKQLLLLAERFREVPVDAIYSSDLYRARHTAEAVQKYHPVPIQCEQSLREIHLGRWEAKFFGDLKYNEPGLIEQFMKDPYHWKLEGAETHIEAGERLYKAIAELCEENAEKIIAVASHGAAIRAFMSLVTGVPLTDTKNLPPFGNTAVSHLYYTEGKFYTDYINDVSHLEKIKLKPWSASPDLHSIVFEPERDKEYYIHCYSETWKSAHGSLKYFTAGAYVALAGSHHRADPENVLIMMAGDQPAGLLEMDSERGENDDYLWIVLLFIEEPFRRLGCGTQTIGRAVARCRELGRNKIRLNVAEDNTNAIFFYQGHGFHAIKKERGVSGNIYTMELELRRTENA